MPTLDETRTHLLSASHKASHRASTTWSGFANFALQDNVLEVAVGLMYVDKPPEAVPIINTTPLTQPVTNAD